MKQIVSLRAVILSRRIINLTAEEWRTVMLCYDVRTKIFSPNIIFGQSGREWERERWVLLCNLQTPILVLVWTSDKISTCKTCVKCTVVSGRKYIRCCYKTLLRISLRITNLSDVMSQVWARGGRTISTYVELLTVQLYTCTVVRACTDWQCGQEGAGEAVRRSSSVRGHHQTDSLGTCVGSELGVSQWNVGMET